MTNNQLRRYGGVGGEGFTPIDFSKYRREGQTDSLLRYSVIEFIRLCMIGKKRTKRDRLKDVLKMVKNYD